MVINLLAPVDVSLETDAGGDALIQIVGETLAVSPISFGAVSFLLAHVLAPLALGLVTRDGKREQEDQSQME